MFEAAKQALTMQEKTIEVHYYAMLRERLGRDADTIRTTAGTAAELLAELRARDGWDIPDDKLQVGINQEMQKQDHPIRDGDRLDLIPPVSGG